MSPHVWGPLVLGLVLVYSLGALFYQYLFPKLRKEKLREYIEFVSIYLMLPLDPPISLPHISVCDREDMIELIPEKYHWKFVVNDIRVFGIYFKIWNKFYFDRSVREEWYVHEIIHYVLQAHGVKFANMAEEEDEVGRVTQFFLLAHYPARFTLITMLYGLLKIWEYDDCIGSEPVTGPA